MIDSSIHRYHHITSSIVDSSITGYHHISLIISSMIDSSIHGYIKVVSRYKFYLAFENAPIMDYVSEKVIVFLIIYIVALYCNVKKER